MYKKKLPIRAREIRSEKSVHKVKILLNTSKTRIKTIERVRS